MHIWTFKLEQTSSMEKIDARIPEDKEPWEPSGPNVVRRPGEVRALIWRMFPWYVTGFFAAISVGSMLTGFWVSTLLATLLTIFSLSTVRRRFQDKTRIPLYNQHSSAGFAILALATVGFVCEWELQNRIDEFETGQSSIFAQADQALEAGEYSRFYALEKRYSIMPSQPLKSYVVRAQALEEEAFQQSLEGRAQRLLEEYQRQRKTQESGSIPNSKGVQ